MFAKSFLGGEAPGGQAFMGIRVVKRFQYVLVGNAIECPLFLSVGQNKDVIGGEVGHSRGDYNTTCLMSVSTTRSDVVKKVVMG